MFLKKNWHAINYSDNLIKYLTIRKVTGTEVGASE